MNYETINVDIETGEIIHHVNKNYYELIKEERTETRFTNTRIKIYKRVRGLFD